MDTIVFPGNVLVQGTLTPATANLPANSVGNTQIPASAGVTADKLQHAHREILAQGSAVTAAAQTQVVHVVVGATAVVKSFKAGAVVAAIGTDTCTVDLKKNGSSILSAPISLTSAQTARQLVAGTITSPNLVAGDVLEVVVTPTHSSGTLATGIFCAVDAWEDSQ